MKYITSCTIAPLRKGEESKNDKLIIDASPKAREKRSWLINNNKLAIYVGFALLPMDFRIKIHLMKERWWFSAIHNNEMKNSCRPPSRVIIDIFQEFSWLRGDSLYRRFMFQRGVMWLSRSILDRAWFLFSFIVFSHCDSIRPFT